MKTLFHVLTHGCPMLEYETLYELFASLCFPNNSTMHWSNFTCWTFVEFMHTQVESATFKAIYSSQFIALFCDQVTTIDNGLWICVHAYVVAYWIKVLILMCIDRIVNGSSYNNLIEVIIIALLKGGGLTMEKLVKKLLCFGVVGSIHFMVKKHESQNKSRILGHHFRWVFIVLPIRQTWRFNPWRI